MANPKRKITAIAPWFGGKRAMAADIIAELGPHRCYLEPFCGCCAVLLAKPAVPHETVNDLHGDLINLAMVVASDRYADLYERLSRTICCEAIFDDVNANLAGSPATVPSSVAAVEEENVRRAYSYFIASWMGRNGVSGTHRYKYQIAVRWTPHGGSGPTRVANTISSMPWWHRRLRNVLILNRDAFEILEKIEDEPGTALYVDPPYLAHTRGTGRTTGHPGGSNYLHDFQPSDHERLAVSLARFARARIVLSYYDDPALADLYPTWTKRLLYRQKNLHVQNRRGSGKKTAPEILLINGPSLVHDTPTLFTQGAAP